MGNAISQIPASLGLRSPEQLAAERADGFLTSEATLPPGFHDWSARLATLDIVPQNRQRFAVRAGSDLERELNEAIITLTALTPEHSAPGDRRTFDARCEAVALLMRLSLLEAFAPVRHFDAGENAILVARQTPPFWLLETFRQLAANKLCAEGDDSGPEISCLPIKLADFAEVKSLPLHLAALTGDEAKLREHLASGLDVDFTDSANRVPLHAAVSGGNPACAKALLDHGASIEARDQFERSPLDMAVMKGRLDLVNLLLKAGARVDHVDTKGNTVIALAAAMDKADIVDRLLGAGADINATGGAAAPLHNAIMLGNAKLTEMLLKRGADPRQLAQWDKFKPEGAPAGAKKTVTAAELAVLGGRVKVLGLLKKYGVDLAAPCPDGSMLMNLAAAAGDLNMIDALLAAGAPVDGKDHKSRSALHWAAGHGRKRVAERLIARGAPLEAKDHRGQSVMHAAVAMSSEELLDDKITVIGLLAEAGAKLNERNNDGESPLHYCAHDPSGRLAGALLDAGAMIEVLNHERRTPLHAAAVMGNLPMLRLLLARRANPNAADNLGNTPLHHLVNDNARDHLEGDVDETLRVAASLLLQWGAKISARNRNHMTPLHAAAQTNNASLVAFLLDQGADPEASGKAKLTPIEIARLRGNFEVLSLMGGDADTSSASSRPLHR